MICVVFGTIGGLAGIYLVFFANTLTTIIVGYLIWFFFGVGLYGAAPAVMTESFPTRVRGTGVSFAGGALWVRYYFTGILLPILIKYFGILGTVFAWTTIAS